MIVVHQIRLLFEQDFQFDVNRRIIHLRLITPAKDIS